MPHVVSLSSAAKWREGVLSGDFTDAEFGFLGSFQELLPEDLGSAKKKDKKQDKQKQTSGNEKKKKKRKQVKENGQVNAKRVKFAEEVSVAEQAPREAEEAGTKDEGEEIKRIVIDDEEDQETENNNDNKSSWDELYLPEPIMKAIKDLGFRNPTEIQRQVLPLAVRDRCDVLGAAETGSGKTLTYAVPMLSRLLELPEEPQSSRSGPNALILAPTRELVVQVMKHVSALLKYTKFKAFSIVGGLAQVRQARILKEQKPEIIVATPGRLWAMMKEEEDGSRASDYLADWSCLACLVVDETDRMVEKGHFEEMQDILQFLTGMRPQCKIVDITRAFGTAEALVETRINCSNLLEKDTAIVYLLERYKGRTLIFTNSVDASRRMYGILKLLKLQPLMIHAKMEQKVRLKNLEKFAADSRSVYWPQM
ncbi:DEAD/DEAH box helicase [Oesophagostomum dentatum]|uniref:ATP-dependent RNA helicase n=1 Tax=Oesophagostomum dentatum TaxID=61180 RepID=A0A0B1T4Q3_OESDE|nr:DEAD/DEAH box helicase [Oesophagostomum dentatum]